MRFLPPNVVQFNSKHLSDLTYNMKTEVYYWISVQPKGSKISEPRFYQNLRPIQMASRPFLQLRSRADFTADIPRLELASTKHSESVQNV